ncbi:hypothetical protein [[Clostridium] hylemonae]|uniref:hypothetical protein n=1 Tax=[Clostridium] hylemonae TaxID=89153 RepID=UPI001D07E35C|nr:hypothetical protein [[Clostridium] hylemonae]MCB7523437.1 hypothetical protein [[Clostridium] hylemonae]BDF05062.1 hypothetical protein CE91St63_21240 [[Clostridium] hylemonae]
MSKNRYYCKIDGKIYNLKKIQDIIDENPEHPDIAKIYIAAVEEYHLPTNTMLDSVITFNNNEIPADYNEALKRMQEYNQASLPKSPPKPRCPRCGSTDIRQNHRVVNSDIGLYEKYYICHNCLNTFKRLR